ncbi:hypothetical protein JOC70_003164 [Clostridium pascui]|uniref:hypothetical protein n=1 Tax=Clostridium pascui TaxID=46609 RepID=UPI00195ABCF4|nr:hypothetical protein [Clostridium pascui]MBM7871654.1 hypothetical protein [Clostridium pascui]
MFFTEIICFTLIILFLILAVKPLKVANIIRTTFHMQELHVDDSRIFLLRASGIAGIIVFSVFLILKICS